MGEYTGTLLSSLSKADFTRFKHKIFSKPITIVNIALFILKFLNLPQGDILTRTEIHVGSKDLQEAHPQQHQPYDLPSWGQIKTLTNQAKNLVTQQGMFQNPENLLIAMLTPSACTDPCSSHIN